MSSLCAGQDFLYSLSHPILSSAPSAVSIIHQVSRTTNSITLSWSQPDQPNGVILDYELQYYEKVHDPRFSHIWLWQFYFYSDSIIVFYIDAFRK